MNSALLSTAQNRQNFALHSAQIGTWEWDIQTDVIWWDEQMHTLAGLAAGTFTGHPAVFFDLLHEEDREQARGEIARTMENCAEFDGEFRTVRPPDGSVRLLKMRWKAHCDDHGKISQIVGAAWDITEQRSTELALAKKRQLLSTLMEHLPDNIYFKDLDSRFIAVNRAMCTWVGLNDPAELIGKSDQDLFTGEHAQRALEDEREIIRTGQPLINREEKETWPDREATWVSTTKMPLLDIDGRISGTFGLSRDITQLKNLENTLRGERNLLRSVINNIPDPIFVKDSQGRYILDNVAHRRSVGKRNEEDVIGKTVFDFFSETSALNFRRVDEEIVKSGVPMMNYEEEAIWPDGTRRWFLSTKVPLCDEAQTVIVCIKRDITERKRSREELARLTQELVAKNEALQEDLEMARELQTALLPQHFPCFPHNATQQESAVRFYHFFQPSMIVSGDFFDVLDISDDKAGLFICDVMGHGVRAALVAATLRSLLAELRPLWTDPGEFLVRINRALVETLKNSTTIVFASAFHMVVDLSSGELCYSNAGHPRPLRVTHTAGAAESVPLNGDTPGPALGLIENAKYRTSRCNLSPHDVILLFTDGLFEVEGLGGLLYDYDQLSRAVNHHAGLPTGELCHRLIAEVQQFSANRRFDDDVCLVAMDIARLKQNPRVG
jgi:sigma-B regulation protein RsbU (phosphoserine phosphatase)